MIELRTLGAIQLRGPKGMDLCAKLQPKRLALLIYLAHPPRRYHRRESLLALFWPELDAHRARNSLRQSLYALRQALGRNALVGRGYEEVAVADRLWSDVVALDSALEKDQVAEAIDLYQGDFLVGFHVQNVASEYEHWLDSERIRLRDNVVRAAAGLAAEEESHGDLWSAVRWAQKAAQLDPDNETIVQQVIELLDQVGDRTGAVRTYEKFARRSREEYDLEPTEETQELISAVRDRDETKERSDGREPAILEPLTSFIGRKQELAELEAWLTGSDTRLLTLTGIGGCGKSRLALELARRVESSFDDGCVHIALSEALDNENVLSAIARGMGLRLRGPMQPEEAIRTHLAGRERLLLLDGFEQIRTAGPTIAVLLHSIPGLTILVTSRVPLKVSCEREFPVPPLSLPQDGLVTTVEFPMNSEAVALFVDRARLARPNFGLTPRNVEAVSEICHRLDGLPLAIELAAARIKTLTPQAILERLGDRFALLTHGPVDGPARQNTLEGAIEWSYQLLDGDERAVFRRLRVFKGGFGLDLIEPFFEEYSVSSMDLIDRLATLVDYGLIRQLEIEGEPRFEMLDTVRAYAQQTLIETGEEERCRHRHATQMLAWVEEGQRCYCTSEQDAWFRRLEREHDNVTSALRWALNQGDGSKAARFGAALWPFWGFRGYLSEGKTFLDEILSLDASMGEHEEARALLAASWISSAKADHDRAIECAEKSAELNHQLGDEAGYLRALEATGFVQLEAGHIEAAETTFTKCLDRSSKDQNDHRRAVALDALTQVALAREDDDRARLLLEESMEIARQIGHHATIGHGLTCQGDIAYRAGRLNRAAELYQEALGIFRELGQQINIGCSLSRLGRVFVEQGQLAEARGSLTEALVLFRESGYVRGIAKALAGFAALAVAEEKPERAVRLLVGIGGLLERTNNQLLSDEESDLAVLRASAGELLPQAALTRLRAEAEILQESVLVALALEGGEPAVKHQALG